MSQTHRNIQNAGKSNHMHWLKRELYFQEVQDLQGQLDSEKKKSKDLASQIVKLNGIIKTGQDAIHQEQELVTKLKQQLEEREKVDVDQRRGD